MADVVAAHCLVDTGEPRLGEGGQHHLEGGYQQERVSDCDDDLGEEKRGTRGVVALMILLV